jgi:uncharacterized membrane protein (UPF0127 family)
MSVKKFRCNLQVVYLRKEVTVLMTAGAPCVVAARRCKYSDIQVVELSRRFADSRDIAIWELVYFINILH